MVFSERILFLQVPGQVKKGVIQKEQTLIQSNSFSYISVQLKYNSTISVVQF